MEKNRQYMDILDHLSEAVFFVDQEYRVTFWNAAAERITGHLAVEVLGHPCASHLQVYRDGEGTGLCKTGCLPKQAMAQGSVCTRELMLTHKKGHMVPVRATALPLWEKGRVVGAAQIFSPLQPQDPGEYDQSLVETLSELVLRDSLTGLPNRRHLESHLAFKLHEAKVFAGNLLVVFLDIDNFRDFNNQYGHTTGDDVLVALGRAVRRNLRKSDQFGRWGGEEFLGVFDVTGLADAGIPAEKIRKAVEKIEIFHQEKPLRVTCSLGATLAKANDTPESIVDRADELMYVSKRSGKNRVTFG